jgi:hypothetical protein
MLIKPILVNGDLVDAMEEEETKTFTDKAFRKQVEYRRKTLLTCIRTAQQGYWITKDKQKIDLKDMSKTHIEKVIMLIERKNWYSSIKEVKYLLQPLYKELKFRKGVNQ